MIIMIPGKVINANRVLNRLNSGIKFMVQQMTKFVGENEKFSATGSHCRQNLVWQTVRHDCRFLVQAIMLIFMICGVVRVVAFAVFLS